MSEPPQPNEPEQAGPNEVQQRGKNPALGQLTQARDKKTHECGNDVTRRTLRHTNVEKWINTEQSLIWLDNHKGTLTVTRQTNHHRPV